MKKLLLSTVLLSTALFAESTPLVTHTELSYVNTTGNSETQSFALNSKAKKSVGAHTFSLAGDALYSEAKQQIDANTSKTVMNKNKWSVTGNYDYSFNTILAMNYYINNKADRFSGYDNQFSTGPGLVVNAYTSKTQTLSIKANVLYSRDDITKTGAADYKSPNEYGALFGALTYEWKILDNLKVSEDATYKRDASDADAYFATSKTALENKISDVFSLGASYNIDYVNQKEAKYYTDNTFLLSLIIDY